MLLYIKDGNSNNDPSKKITDEELQSMANTILEIVDIYYKNIFIKDEETKQALVNIHDLAILIKQRKYNELFENPNIVDMSNLINENGYIITDEDRHNWDSFFALNPY